MNEELRDLGGKEHSTI